LQQAARARLRLHSSAGAPAAWGERHDDRFLRYIPSAMDPLSDLLRVVRLDGAYFYAVQAAGPWTVETVAARELSPRIMPDAEHLISYHIVTGGRCYGGVIGDELVELAAGDVIVFPHGDAHVMSSGRDVRIGEDVQRTRTHQVPCTVLLRDQAP